MRVRRSNGRGRFMMMFCRGLRRCPRKAGSAILHCTALHPKLEAAEELFVPSLETSEVSGTRCLYEANVKL